MLPYLKIMGDRPFAIHICNPRPETLWQRIPAWSEIGETRIHPVPFSESWLQPQVRCYRGCI